jgi:CRISPR-associated protein Csb2
LTPEQHSLATHLLERIGYLGRAESWAEGAIAKDWDGEFNACPRAVDTPEAADSVPVDVALPVTPSKWAELQVQLVRELDEKNMTKRERAVVEATLPSRLSDALAVDTGEWQKVGWSSPPPLRKIVYDRPVVGPLPAISRRPETQYAGQPGTPQAARFVLVGRPEPRIEDALRIGEIARLALMSIGKDPVPAELSGRDDEGPLRDDPAHRHAFFLPEDADGDGLIDHLIVFCRLGFSEEARRRLDRLTRLWIEHGRANEEGERGRKEWRVALEDIAAPASFADSSRLLRRARTWVSVTPYLKNRFDKKRPKTLQKVVETYRDQIVSEWRRRYPDAPVPMVDALFDGANPARFAVPIGLSGTLRFPLAFARTRGRRGGRQPDASGGFFRLTFEEDVEGPIALGWGAHFGLGIFAASQD